MNKAILLLIFTILIYMHSIWLLGRNMETGNTLKIIWGLAELLWGMWLLQQALKPFAKAYLQKNDEDYS